jgi:hypothetical protein
MKLFYDSKRWFLFALTSTALAVSAQAGILKADPAPPSCFLTNPQAMRSDSCRSPFDKVWRNPSPQAWARVQGFDRVVIMPVNTNYFQGTPEQRAELEKMAVYMRGQFQKQFAQGGAYRVVSQPGPRTLVLELALVELKPTNVAGNVVGTGARAVVPGANFIGSAFTHGNVAFEAKVRNGQTGELLAQYADRQRDKMALFSFRDYSATAHNRKAIDDWAKQMEELARTPDNHRVAGAMRVTLNPF